MATERPHQFEFKVIVWGSSESWPHEIRNALENAIVSFSSAPILKVVSVERIEDGY